MLVWPGKHDHQVLADLEEGLRQRALESLAVGQQQHQRGDAPGDAEHGERRRGAGNGSAR